MLSKSFKHQGAVDPQSTALPWIRSDLGGSGCGRAPEPRPSGSPPRCHRYRRSHRRRHRRLPHGWPLPPPSLPRPPSSRGFQTSYSEVVTSFLCLRRRCLRLCRRRLRWHLASPPRLPCPIGFRTLVSQLPILPHLRRRFGRRLLRHRRRHFHLRCSASPPRQPYPTGFLPLVSQIHHLGCLRRHRHRHRRRRRRRRRRRHFQSVSSRGCRPARCPPGPSRRRRWHWCAG